VRIGTQALPELANNILAMRVVEQIGGLSHLELKLNDMLSLDRGATSWGATATSPLQLGAAIKIFLGPMETPREVFDGLITAIEGEYGGEQGATFTVLAEDRLWAARRKRRTRTFEDKTPGDIVRQLSADHSLTPQIRDGLDGPTMTWWQMNESDLAFLRRVLGSVDGDLQCVDSDLQVGIRAKDARTAITITQGNQLIRCRVIADLADQVTSVTVGGWDTKAGQPVSQTATSAASPGPGAGTDGASVLRNKLGEIVETVGDQAAKTDDIAKRRAAALYGQRARRFVRIDAMAQGDPQIRVGSKVSVAGVNPFFANDYSVTQAVHRFDLANGYITEFLGECAYLGAGA
jgi:uncharacterized protein